MNQKSDIIPTIVALSSGKGLAAIAVIRISGPRARFGLETTIGRVPSPRRASLATVRDPTTKEPIDQALALWFPGPETETGEDMAELHTHGGRAVVEATLTALTGLEGFRLAEAGEFTRRAFENGQIDLTVVEGLADLIGAETQSQRRQAFQQLVGTLGKRADAWRQRLTEALALVEANIDFSDEGDVPADLSGQVLRLVTELKEEISKALAGAARGERLREGLTVAVAGPPNAGKSTLFNALARRDVAIVSPIPGTTRDVLEVHLDLNGYPVTVLDTAGIRESGDPVEREGIDRARSRAAAADLVLWITEPGDLRAPPPLESPIWRIQSKADLVDSDAKLSSGRESEAQTRFSLSAKTGEGLEHFVGALSAFAGQAFGSGESALVTRLRHRLLLERVVETLNRASKLGGSDLELLAEELRAAATDLGRLLGKIDVEDVLDVIFRDFCIGK
ncbi:MAG: tRNA uridine-5-carboxymethylaminomethyl(34) synthesis GTPase MnmE [Rhizobiales bacterium]|nr:tRNA uridine-5-carboxymethylaminomethyl(34) synthesis GTPase MnmE [Hyphomicrobiales bacterium]